MAENNVKMAVNNVKMTKLRDFVLSAITDLGRSITEYQMAIF